MWDNLFIIEINIELGLVIVYSLDNDNNFEFQIPNEGKLTSSNELHCIRLNDNIKFF